jgi:hypothetical protein
MQTVELLEPIIRGQTVRLPWRITPHVRLYREPWMEMSFPDSIDVTRIPRRLWWDIMLITLHQHWLFLGPVEVRLPFRMSEGEIAFWGVMFDNAMETLRTMRLNDDAPTEASITLVSGPLEAPQTPIEGDGFGGAFSGGKDSLLQAAMLFELTERPLLVATTSPMPPLSDHLTKRRREVLVEIQRRRNPLFAEVTCNLRANWDNAFSARRGFRTGLNELSDTLLYMSSLLLLGAATGHTRLFLASETEVQESKDEDGRIVQHPHYMYSAATMRSLAAYLAPYRFRFGSFAWGLYSMQVQRLLWDRYPALSDLQYSCWRVKPGQKTCSECDQCLRIAMTAIAAGHDPRRMGISVKRLMAYAPTWEPVKAEETYPPDHPATIVSRRSRGLVAGLIQDTSVLKFAWTVGWRSPTVLLSARHREALGNYRRLRKLAAGRPRPPKVAVREAFLDWIDPDLRPRVEAIYRQHLDFEERSEHLAIFQRSEELARRAISALEGGR